MADAELNVQRIGLVVDYREKRLSLSAYEEKPYEPTRNDITYKPRAAPIPEGPTGQNGGASSVSGETLSHMG
jgi:hypothetical protein